MRQRPPTLAFATQVRFTERQRRYLLVRATRERTTVSEVVRHAIEDALAREVVQVGDTDDVMPLWPVLDGMDSDQVEELAERLEPWGPQEPVT